jgi:DNA-binding IclR family transcriptional regulator
MAQQRHKLRILRASLLLALIPFTPSTIKEATRLLIDFREAHEKDYSIDQEETVQDLG